MKHLLKVVGVVAAVAIALGVLFAPSLMKAEDAPVVEAGRWSGHD